MTDDVQPWLQHYISEHGAVAGTVHLADGDGLALHASVNIPPKVAEIVQHVPRGKGMAGLALERDEPVSTCNLKTDETGDVRPGARGVDANAAVAIPIHHADGSVRGVVGIAFMGERDMDDSELAELTRQAEALPG